jgi:uncharacterized protein (DUF433 family)
MNTANIWTDENRRSGLPCLRNTRFTISQLIAEIAERGSVSEVSDTFDLDPDTVRGALEDVATFFDHPTWDKRVKNI